MHSLLKGIARKKFWYVNAKENLKRFLMIHKTRSKSFECHCRDHHPKWFKVILKTASLTIAFYFICLKTACNRATHKKKSSIKARSENSSSDFSRTRRAAQKPRRGISRLVFSLGEYSVRWQQNILIHQIKRVSSWPKRKNLLLTFRLKKDGESWFWLNPRVSIIAKNSVWRKKEDSAVQRKTANLVTCYLLVSMNFSWRKLKRLGMKW